MSPINTLTSEDISAASLNARYDQACKRVLSNKQILAWIMKRCVEEYKDCTIKDIAEKYIEGEPEIGSAPMRPDQSGRIKGSATEDNSIFEHTIHYDIKFSAITPDSSGEIGLIINIEAQNKYNNGYPLIKRGLYYCSRLISAQYGTEFTESHYESIKKVYSIWICMNAPRDRQNSITEYGICEKNIIGEVKEEVANYDLLKTVMICLGDEDDPTDKLLKLLNVLFSNEMNVSDKKHILNDEFDIPMSGSIEEEVNHMCNLSQGVLDKGISIGRGQGIEIGRGQGIEIGRCQGIEIGEVKSLRKMMKNFHVSFTEAADSLEIPKADRPKYKKLVEDSDGNR